MENQGLAYLLLLACLYFLPAIIASVKGRPNTGAIWALNILGGWTVVGWIVSFIWALTSGRSTTPNIVVNAAPLSPVQDPTKRCPSCAETVLRDARKCKHCGESFETSMLAQPARRLGLASCPGCGKLRGLDVQKCVYCGDTSSVSITPSP